MKKWCLGHCSVGQFQQFLSQGQLEQRTGQGKGEEVPWDHATPTWAAPGSQVGPEVAEGPNFWGRGTYQQNSPFFFFFFLCCLALSPCPSRCSLEVLEPWALSKEDLWPPVVFYAGGAWWETDHHHQVPDENL